LVSLLGIRVSLQASEIFEALEEIPSYGLGRDEMLKAYGILGHHAVSCCSLQEYCQRLTPQRFIIRDSHLTRQTTTPTVPFYLFVVRQASLPEQQIKVDGRSRC